MLARLGDPRSERPQPNRGGREGSDTSLHDIYVVSERPRRRVKHNLVQILRAIANLEQNVHCECRALTEISA